MSLYNIKIGSYQRSVFEIAKRHGWHETEMPWDSYIALAIVEICEAINADRVDHYCRQNLTDIDRLSDDEFKAFYEENVKDTVETEIADAVMYLLDYAYVRWGDNLNWDHYDVALPYKNGTFLNNAYVLIKQVLGILFPGVAEGVYFCYKWAEYLGFDLDAHIKCKMRFNDLRPYRHGGKKY